MKDGYISKYNERNYAAKGRYHLDQLLKKKNNALKKEALCKKNVEIAPVMLNQERNIAQNYAITSQPEENTTKVMKTLKKLISKKDKVVLSMSQENLNAKSVTINL